TAAARRHHARHRGPLGDPPGRLLPVDGGQAAVPDGTHPPPLRTGWPERASDHPAFLARHGDRRRRGVIPVREGSVVNVGAEVPAPNGVDADQTDLFVYGLGRSGTSVVKRARRQGLEVAFYDARAEGPDVDEALAAGATRVSDVSHLVADAFPTCVAAPGVSIDHPDLESLRQRGVHVTGEVEWTWGRVSGRYVGITGTAGKGSTTLWLRDVLRHAGVDAVAGGNNDPALAAVARAGATHVVELSSFQLERTYAFRPDVAVVLNLGEDHI